jgi:phosphatidylethanolamine-binding protein (PEBP) family uncharacterized protein
MTVLFSWRITEELMRPPVFLAVIVLSTLIIGSCTGESNYAAAIGVEFEWQPIDYGSQKNPEIRLTGVPAGTKRFFVSLVDLNVSTYDHGGGFVDNDGSGIIASGSIRGNYNGPAPWLPDMIHDYEITVKACDENKKVVGIGKKVKKFLYGPAE